ncbi:DNA polymerase III subunit [bacterium]|nr:DNA polymerase III subunit [candidate division CSSED10-310 bacterium]
MIFGHKTIREMLDRSVKNGHLPHAMLFWGAKGIGKYSMALDLIRRLNCEKPNNGSACGVCHNCLRIGDPFPFHPDVVIMRDLTTPLFLKRDIIFSRYLSENGMAGQLISETDQLDYIAGIEELGKLGTVARSSVCTKANPPLDVLYLSPDKLISQSILEKYASKPMIYWLFSKIKMHQESNCYNRTIKIENIREIQKILYLHPFESQYKTVVIDDADKMLPPAQNCLLKILEEPPSHSVLILVVTHPKGLLPTIRSRCQVIPFYRLPENELTDGLVRVFGWDEQTALDHAGPACGSISEALGTDWDIEKACTDICDRLFDAGEEQDAEWVLKAVSTILTLDSTGESRGLLRFYRWLHDRVCENPDSSEMSGRLPRHRPLTVDSALQILDGVDEILSQTVYHTDVRLQLESMLFGILEEMD